MAECTSIEHNFHETPNISNDQQFRLSKITETKDYFIAECREVELMRKNLSKYIASFDCLDKPLIILSVATGSVSIASSATVIGAPVGIMSASCRLEFSITAGFVETFLKTIRN